MKVLETFETVTRAAMQVSAAVCAAAYCGHLWGFWAFDDHSLLSLYGFWLVCVTGVAGIRTNEASK